MLESELLQSLNMITCANVFRDLSKLVTSSLHAIRVSSEVDHSKLSRHVSSLSTCDHQVKHFIDHIILIKNVLSSKHERQDITISIQVALDLS